MDGSRNSFCDSIMDDDNHLSLRVVGNKWHYSGISPSHPMILSNHHVGITGCIELKFRSLE
jgi:hypothetical protein